MTERIQAIRGMNDILPVDTYKWRYVEDILTSCLLAYGYQEIRFPLLESTQLFKRTIGEVTDIVEKEMYTFADLNGDSLTLRPEGTAGCVRACLEHGLLYNQQQKLWYLGPMFRHERPQKGRYRQFSQFGVEVFGISGVAIELELISICYRLWNILGIDNHVQLQINSLGLLEERQRYKVMLTTYLKDNISLLDEDSKRRLDKNPLRILDSKNSDMQALIQNAPKLVEHLGEESKSHFDELCAGLKALNIPYIINPTLVRGLDYYGKTVFEWVTDKLGSQATVCAGGRYDVLVEQLGGTQTPAVGFALGIERILLLLDTLSLLPSKGNQRTIYIIATSNEAAFYALQLADTLRSEIKDSEVIVNTAGGSFKSQFKKADKSGARIALIIGDDELQNKRIGVKDLREAVEQTSVDEAQIIQYLTNYLA